MSVSEGTILKAVASILFSDSVIMQNVFHLVLSSVVGDNDEEDIVIDVIEYIEAIYDTLVDAFDADLVSSDVKVYEYDDIDDDFDEVGTDTWSFSPVAAGDMLPHGVAAVVNLYTIDPDTQGRKFFGGFSEGLHFEHGWNAATMVDLADAATAITDLFTATVTSNLYAPGVWSPTHTIFRLFNGSFAVNLTAGYQRRRKPGVGI